MDAGNVVVAVSGAVYVAPLTAAAPASAGEALSSDWKNVGYISSEGVKEATNTEWSEIKAWQNSEVVRKSITKQEVTYALTMIETNTQSLALFYGTGLALKTSSGGTVAGFATSAGGYPATYTTVYPLAATPPAPTPTGSSHVIGTTPGRVSLVIDSIDGTKKMRRYAPSAEVTEKGEVLMGAAEAMGYPVTITCYPTAALGGSVEAHYLNIL